MSKMDEFIEALRESRGYNWIANHGWELSREELINIIKEYDYAIHSKVMKIDNEEDMYFEIAEELEAIYEEE